MVSLYLTKPHIDGRLSELESYSDRSTNVKTEHSKQSSYKALKNANKQSVGKNDLDTISKTEYEKQATIKQTFFQKGINDHKKRKTTTEANQNLPKPVESKFDPTSVWSRESSEKLFFYTEESTESQRRKMLATVQAMGDQNHKRKTSSRLHKRFIRQYSQYMPDARKDRYFIHKWRVKSGRIIDTNLSDQRPVIQSLQKLQKQKNIRKTHLKKKSLHTLFRNVESRYMTEAVPKTSMLKGKEELFGVNAAKTSEVLQQLHHSKSKRASFLPRLRNQLQNWNQMNLQTSDLERMQDSSLAHQTDHESVHLETEFEAMHLGRDISLLPQIQPKRRASINLTNRNDILPPIYPIKRRQSFPMRQRSLQYDHKTGPPIKRRVSVNPTTSPMAIPENKVFNPPQQIAAKTRTSSSDMVPGKHEKTEHESAEHLKVLGGSPVHKKSHSSMTQHSYSTTRSGSKEGKDGDTPTDSEGSLGASKYRRTRKMRGSRMLTKMESRNSPQFRYIKPYRMDVLMRQWYISVKLSIWLARLYKSHRVVVDDSYNIRSGSNASEEEVGSDIKKEVLFDVTDYKMKNQLRLSDTTRRVLLLPSQKRTEKDVNLVQTALRNIKAIADYSNVVQKQIGRQGYFVGFEGKRVVVKENKPPLNYYLLLAGSAVVIKSDETGNTNPVLFMKRGDIFGEKEILDDMKWQWSVATSGYCEFLLLSREDYKSIFITGGGGGLLSDPDRGGFLRSIDLLHHWPITILGDNPNRCLFRYFKRGALLVHDSNLSEWIYVVKSGSCSVLKQLQVQPLTEEEIFLRMKREQKFRSKISADPRLVEKTKAIEQEEHVNRLQEREEEEKNKVISVFQQLEMSSILKELNPDVIGTTVSPRAEAGFDDFRSEFPLSSYKADATFKKTPVNQTNRQNADEEHENHTSFPKDNDEEDFRLSRHSDRHPPRTPSPTKAAYLRTGISTRSAKRDSGSQTSRLEDLEEKYNEPPDIIVTDVHQPEKPPKKLISPQKQVHINEFLFGSNNPEDVIDEDEEEDVLQPVHINVRQLTKKDVFGMEPHLYSNQPSLTLVSNGAECLMLNKKFYLENANEECMKWLKEAGYPYPSDAELEEQHWRVLTWKAYQASVIRELLVAKEG